MKYLGAGGGGAAGVGVEDWGRGTERRGGGAISTATQSQEKKIYGACEAGESGGRRWIGEGGLLDSGSAEA